MTRTREENAADLAADERLKRDWQYAVANGDTLMGYAEWLEHRARTATLRETVAEIITELEEFGCGSDEPMNGGDAVNLINSLWMDLKVAYEVKS